MFMKSKLYLNYKIVTRYKIGCNSDEAKEQRFNFVRKMINLINNKYIIVFIDETGINFESH